MLEDSILETLKIKVGRNGEFVKIWSESGLRESDQLEDRFKVDLLFKISKSIYLLFKISKSISIVQEKVKVLFKIIKLR